VIVTADENRRGSHAMPFSGGLDARGRNEVLGAKPVPEGRPLYGLEYGIEGNVRRAMRAALKAAELPGHFTPHCLRQTVASLLLQQGESPVYVMEQLGHASIRLTVDTYGKWLPKGNKAAVDRLDEASPEASGSKVVANRQKQRRPRAGAVSQGLGLARNLSGGGYRDRTGDLLIANGQHGFGLRA
jgi:hypothetical protein